LTAFRLRLRPLDGEPDPSTAGLEDEYALKMFQRAARLEPNDADYYFILGRALLRAGRFSEAVGVCLEAVRLNRQDADYHYALGAALWGLERHEEAEAAFREAVRVRPDDARALNGLGCALTRLGRHREAVAVFHQALPDGTNDADVQGNLAVVLWEHGRKAGALRAFRGALRAAPDDALLQRNLGLALNAAGEHEEALALFRKLAESRPADAGAHLDLAETLHALGRVDEMKRGIDEALRLDALALAARPHIREMLDARRLGRLREELARGPRAAASSSLGSRLLLALGDAFGGLGTARRALANLVVLAALAALAHGAYAVVPPYVSRYLLQDDIAGIAGAPVRDDADILDRLMHAVRERGLGAHIREENFEIRTQPKWRRIICRYEQPVEVLPGLVHTFRFHIETERPYLLEPDPRFL
jgi:Flp pilus assembly protein TadD